MKLRDLPDYDAADLDKFEAGLNRIIQHPGADAAMVSSARLLAMVRRRDATIASLQGAIERMAPMGDRVVQLEAEARTAAEREEAIIRATGGHLCRSCGKEAERGRWGPIPYAIPTCYACLPPPPPLETVDMADVARKEG